MDKIESIICWIEALAFHYVASNPVSDVDDIKDIIDAFQKYFELTKDSKLINGRVVLSMYIVQELTERSMWHFRDCTNSTLDDVNKINEFFDQKTSEWVSEEFNQIRQDKEHTDNLEEMYQMLIKNQSSDDPEQNEKICWIEVLTLDYLKNGPSLNRNELICKFEDYFDEDPQENIDKRVAACIYLVSSVLTDLSNNADNRKEGDLASEMFDYLCDEVHRWETNKLDQVYRSTEYHFADEVYDILFGYE